LEVDTPVRIPAPAPEFYIDAIPSSDWFLQTSPELCMKRLLAAGYSRTFQICKCFRHAERGKKHLPELTMLEWYRAGQNYRDLMTECEELIRFISHHLGRGDKIFYQGKEIDLQRPWKRMSVAEAFDQYAPTSMEKSLAKGSFDELMVAEIEPNLGAPKPLFLFDYPASRGALARLKPENQAVAERFELYIAGLELCNGFSELINPVEQRNRFEKEQRRRKRAGQTIYPMPEKFLETLCEMPAAAGNALGIDRLAMLFVNTDKIDDVVTFTPEEL
jgi:lysyl-tRNA synthetase class 2